MSKSLLARLTHQVGSEKLAVSLLTERGDMVDGKLTAHGKERQKMGAAGRAKDRAAKYSGGKHAPAEYKYNSKTNGTKLR